jgi:hypothetical protein
VRSFFRISARSRPERSFPQALEFAIDPCDFPAAGRVDVVRREVERGVGVDHPRIGCGPSRDMHEARAVIGARSREDLRPQGLAEP